MKKIIWTTLLSLSLLILAACGSAESMAPEAAITQVEAAAPAQSGQEVAAPAEPLQGEADPPQSAAAAAGPGETLVDEQGAVAVAVTPRTLDPSAAALDFEVAMNTHSVDLSMDLSQLATLTTDTGLQVSASGWDAPQGGHHVSGVLSFPSLAEDGTLEDGHLLDGVSALTLTLINVDAPERTFTWSLK